MDVIFWSLSPYLSIFCLKIVSSTMIFLVFRPANEQVQCRPLKLLKQSRFVATSSMDKKRPNCEPLEVCTVFINLARRKTTAFNLGIINLVTAIVHGVFKGLSNNRLFIVPDTNKRMLTVFRYMEVRIVV